MSPVINFNQFKYWSSGQKKAICNASKPELTPIQVILTLSDYKYQKSDKNISATLFQGIKKFIFGNLKTIP